AVCNADRAAAQAAARQTVVRGPTETSPDDCHGMAAAQGILPARGGAPSHAAVVARQIGKPCVARVHELLIDYAKREATTGKVTFKEGDAISVDGSTGEVYLGAIPTVH